MRYAWVTKVGMVTLFGVLVLVASPYTASAVKPVPPPAPAVPRVVDATGKLVGQVIGTSVENEVVVPHVVLNISAPSIIVQVTPDSFRGSIPLVYAAPNCTGQPYFKWHRSGVEGSVPVLPISVFPLVAVANNSVYVVQTYSRVEIPSIASTWNVVANRCEPLSLTKGAIVSVADPINSDLSTEFQQPYRFVYP